MAHTRREKEQHLLAGFRLKRTELEKRARFYLGEIESSTFVIDSPLALNGQAILNASIDLKETLAEAAKVQGRIDELQEALGL